MQINVLPIHLVNKIAAGEVIERPASVVKEIIENALDAGATRIDLVVEDGGKRLIAVTDNGSGMAREDLALAFTPHATSKLASEDDLFNIGTMGFRGEALASVASISHAHIRTRKADDDSGYEISASGQDTGEVRPCASAPGTTVTIRDLFFNTPARRKFMRQANTEFGHIAEQVARLALPHPHVAFTVTHNGRETHNLPSADNTRQRVCDLFTPDLGEALLPVTPRENDQLSIAGLIAPPAAARASAKWQYLFLNGRYIRDRSLAHALREAYRGLIAPNRYPVAFLFIDIDPAEVDVNVHPTKIEVRFRETQLVHGTLLAALKETLNRANLAPAASFDPVPATDPNAETAAGEKRDSLRQALADFFKSAPPPQPRFSFPEPLNPAPNRTPRLDPPAPRMPLHSASTHAPATPPASPACGFAQNDTAPSSQSPPYADAPHAGGDFAHQYPAPSHAAPLAPTAVQIHNAYIVTAAPDGLEIIDQHALHERLIYNDLRRRLAEGALSGQGMLIPETLTVTAGEADILAERADMLNRLGIETSPFGPNTVAIQRFPSLLAGRGVAAADFIRELLDKLADDETTDSERLLADVLDMMACKAAVKAGDPLSQAEIEALLARRQEADKASSCPHGRPTTLKLTLADLEKQFHRT